uniref:Uncharacterized protein n=1 Tax=Amphimedon queenslandica TaxID=400682 RepID=A0A1X7U5A0_AMPQE
KKRLTWAQAHSQEAMNDGFKDIMWTDEASLMLESYRRFCCRKKGTQPKPKPRPKHPVKDHV